jgi:superfamily I DNA/RNA helicase
VCRNGNHRKARSPHHQKASSRSDDAVDWRRGGGVLVTTARSFKGLEAAIVIAYGLAGFGTFFTPTDLYVAWTRARHRLILVCQSGDIRAAVEAALADAERSATNESPAEVP